MPPIVQSPSPLHVKWHAIPPPVSAEVSAEPESAETESAEPESAETDSEPLIVALTVAVAVWVPVSLAVSLPSSLEHARVSAKEIESRAEIFFMLGFPG